MSQGQLEIRVRYNECDPMGVAHHAAYPVWFEMGRTELLRSTGRTYADMETEGLFLAVIALEVRYKRAARYDDVMTLTTRVTRISHVKIVHEYELHRGQELLTTASTTLACLDAGGKARALPAFLGG